MQPVDAGELHAPQGLASLSFSTALHMMATYIDELATIFGVECLIIFFLFMIPSAVAFMESSEG